LQWVFSILKCIQIGIFFKLKKVNNFFTILLLFIFLFNFCLCLWIY
jgi:hypothetical protein